MSRVLALAALLLAVPGGVSSQALSVLHITVTVADVNGQSKPVARHALLISDDPATALPRRVFTTAEGTADVRVAPGTYIVESDQPLIMRGQSYQWTQLVKVSAGQDATLALTSANALIETAAEAIDEAARSVPGGSPLLADWQESVVGLWTPHAHATGVLVDARGLIATSQRAIGEFSSVEVQFSPTLKVAGSVLVADAARDVALVWINPAATAGARPVRLSCNATAPRDLANDSDLEAIEVPLDGRKNVTSFFGRVPDAAGSPIFAPDGTVVGLTSLETLRSGVPAGSDAVVDAQAICATLAATSAKMAAAAPPAADRLPVEPGPPVPPEAIKAGIAGRAFAITPYQMTSSDFDIVFITPLLVAGAASREGWTLAGDDDGLGMRAVTDFGDWSDYVSRRPPVVFVRVTPRLVESMWMKVARGAAVTQGVSLPPIKRLRPGFSTLRMRCGTREVTPIHPFVLEQRLSDDEGTSEGLYVFDPAAIGPGCGEVTLELSSAKDPDRMDTRVVDAALIRRIAQDFEILGDAR